MSLDQMLGIFLWMVGRNVHIRDAQSRFQHSKSGSGLPVVASRVRVPLSVA